MRGRVAKQGDCTFRDRPGGSGLAHAGRMTRRASFPQSRLPASIEKSVKLSVCVYFKLYLSQMQMKSPPAFITNLSWLRVHGRSAQSCPSLQVEASYLVHKDPEISSLISSQ